MRYAKFLAGVIIGAAATCLALYLGLLLMGGVASLVHWVVKL